MTIETCTTVVINAIYCLESAHRSAPDFVEYWTRELEIAETVLAAVLARR